MVRVERGDHAGYRVRVHGLLFWFTADGSDEGLKAAKEEAYRQKHRLQDRHGRLVSVEVDLG